MATVVTALGPVPGAGWDTDGYVPLGRTVDRAACAALLARSDGTSGPHHDPGTAAQGAAIVAQLVDGPVAVVSSRLVVTLPGGAGTGRRRPGGDRGGTAVQRLALTPATLATGCPWVVPGSHRRPDHGPPGLPVDGAVPVPLGVGDAVVVDGGLLERVTANHSVDVTAALVVMFHASGAGS